MEIIRDVYLQQLLIRSILYSGLIDLNQIDYSKIVDLLKYWDGLLLK